MSQIRPDWEKYYLGIARAVAARADCSRAQHGAVIVDVERRIVSTGYNGSPSGGPSCLAGECPRAQSEVASLSSYDTGPGACIALHAEQNALLYSSRLERHDGIIYITGEPCGGCLKMIAGSGLKMAVWPEGRWLK